MIDRQLRGLGCAATQGRPYETWVFSQFLTGYLPRYFACLK